MLSAAGAAVTVLDNSPRQLGRDQQVAAREGLTVRTVLGDLRDLGVFPDASFDVVFNPVSNVFCPDLAPVWRPLTSRTPSGSAPTGPSRSNTATRSPGRSAASSRRASP